MINSSSSHKAFSMNRGPVPSLKQPVWQEGTTQSLTPDQVHLDDGIDSIVCPFFPHCLLKASHQHFYNDHRSQQMPLTKKTPASLFVLKNPTPTACLCLFITWQDPRKWNVDRKVMRFRAKYNLQQNSWNCSLQSSASPSLKAFPVSKDSPLQDLCQSNCF